MTRTRASDTARFGRCGEDHQVFFFMCYSADLAKEMLLDAIFANSRDRSLRDDMKETTKVGRISAGGYGIKIHGIRKVSEMYKPLAESPKMLPTNNKPRGSRK